MSRIPISIPSRLALTALALAAACGGERKDGAPADTTAATAASAAPAEARKVGTVKDLKNPESVRWDAEQGIWFVSNVNGNPSDKDGNGYTEAISVQIESSGIAR